MNRKAVLVIGTDEKQLHDSISRLSDNSSWIIVTATAAEEAIEKFHRQEFELVLVIDDLHEEEKKLRKIFGLTLIKKFKKNLFNSYFVCKLLNRRYIRHDF